MTGDDAHAAALCSAFSAGYEAGIHDGTRIGRAQVEAEEWPVWKQFIDQVRAAHRIPGPLGFDKREQWIRDSYRTNCEHPDWTPEQIRHDAHASWVQVEDAIQHASTTPKTVPAPHRQAERRNRHP